MCGIAGWVDFGRNIESQDKVMDNMSVALAPRGPDAKGVYKEKHACFVHRRLIVVDPENGMQPMSLCRGGTKYTIIYNGELYNTEEVRTKLKALNFTFKGHSDTEVLLSAYIAWGENCVDELNGIYAFAVWNAEEKTLFLARDRIGVKPLFYYQYREGIVFSSEIKALLAHPFIRPQLGRSGIAEIMLLGPARRPGDGVFKGIKELKPAFCAKFDKKGLNERQYWTIKAAPHKESFEETAEHLRSLIYDSIERQLVSDVPLCTFLSGGLDSSIISAVTAKKYAETGKMLTTYSVDYRDNRKNFTASQFQPDEDAPWIVKMSEHIGSNHVNIELDTPMLTDALLNSTIARDLPGMADVDSSLWLFCKAVREQFPVALSGECADEIFGGYPWYHNWDILFAEEFPWSTSTDERLNLLCDDIISRTDGRDFVQSAYRETCSHADCLESDSPLERRMREMYMLNFEWFMQTLLDRKDRMSMAHGLEVRVPFCDHRIAEYAYNIPWEMKSYKGREKGLVRQAVTGLLPDDVIWRKKSPYPKTHNPDYMRLVTERFSAILNSNDSRIYEICDRRKLRMLLDTNGASFAKNWYGQLMATPQIFAYLIQLEHWLTHYNIEIIK